MKYVTPEISWHSDREPIYGVDLQPTQPGDINRLATCGGDRFVRLWEITLDDGKPTVSFLSSLNRHTRTVNTVRFSPDGAILASGGDDSVIILWKKNLMVPASSNIFSEEDEECREIWSISKVLRSHLEDVYDICWSSDGNRLISGSIDNSAILWDTNKGCRLSMFTEHRSFVQGVAYDPLGQYLATMSTDRSLRVFCIETKCCLHNVRSVSLPPPPSSPEGEKKKPQRIFHDAKSFFRRLSFSSDGQLLVAPTGCLELSDGQTVNTTFVFVRGNLTKPVLYLPVPNEGSTFAVRFCPVIFQLRFALKTPTIEQNGSEETKTVKENGDCEMEEIGEQTDKKMTDENDNKDDSPCDTLFRLPYRMVFAVLCENSVIFYDTQQHRPFAYVSNIHYRQLTDLSWSSDARTLVVSSTDGYCTLISFEAGELGKPYAKQMADLLGHTKQDSSGQIPTTEKQTKTNCSSSQESKTNAQTTTITKKTTTTTATTKTATKTTTTPMTTTMTKPVDTTSAVAPHSAVQKKPAAVSSGPKPRRVAMTTLTTATPLATASETKPPEGDAQPKSCTLAKRRAALITLSSPSNVNSKQSDMGKTSENVTRVFTVPRDVAKIEESPSMIRSEVKPSTHVAESLDESTNSSLLSASLLPDEDNLHLVLEMSNDNADDHR